MKLSGGEQSPTRRPSSQSPGRERRKPDVGSQRQSSKRARGGEGQKGGRSPSNSRECCGWNEIVTGDHYSNNCPKKKKEEPGRSITPYTPEAGTHLRRGGANQRGETYRMLRGFFGCKPLVKRASKSKGDSGEEDGEEN